MPIWRRRFRRLADSVLCTARGERNVPFYQTNPFCFRVLFDGAISFSETYAVCSDICKWVRFPKRTHFGGGSMTTSFWYKISRRTATERRGYKEEKRRAERREDTTAGGAATTERGPPELWGRYGPG